MDSDEMIDVVYMDDGAEMLDESEVVRDIVLEDSEAAPPEEDEEDGDDEADVAEEEDDVGDMPNDAFVTMAFHTDSVFSVSATVDEDSARVFAGSCDESISVWELPLAMYDIQGVQMDVRAPRVHIQGQHGDSVAVVAHSSDESLVACAGMDGKVTILDATSGEILRDLTGPGDSIDWLHWHPKGNVLLGGSGECAWMWNAKNGTCMNVFSGHTGSVTCGRFTPNGKSIITAAEDGTVKVWNPMTAAVVKTINGGLFHDAPIVSMDVHHDQPLVVTGAADGSVRLCNYTNGKILQKFQDHKDSVEAVRFLKNLPIVVTAAMDGEIRLFNLVSGQIRATFKHDDGVTQLVAHPTEPIVFSGSVDKTVRVWDARSCSCVKVLRGHLDTILELSVSKNGKYVFSCSDDQTIRVFRV